MNQIAQMLDSLKISNPKTYLIITLTGVILVNVMDYFIMFGENEQTKIILQSLNTLIVPILTYLGVRTTRYLKPTENDGNAE